MSRVIVEYFPDRLSDKAANLIRNSVSASMIAHDNETSQYEISICKSICEEYELIKDVILISHLILDDVNYIEL